MTKLPAERRQAVRAALKICEHLASAAPAALAELPLAQWQVIRQLVDRLRLARARYWPAASQALVDDLLASVNHLISDLHGFKAHLPPRRGPATMVRPSEVMADLAALDREFADLEIDLDEHELSVRTEPIELEGVFLGPFRIVLAWNRIGQPLPYKVVAEEPHAAAGRDEVTHPHVCDERLCEGDGAISIKLALASGRLFDFFVLVRQVLQTYNDGSAHVPLDRWEGRACKDCDTWLSADLGSSCERCDEMACGDCTSLCTGCDRYVCFSCSEACHDCNDRYCSACLRASGASEGPFCPACLQNQETPHDPPSERQTAAFVPALPTAPAAAPADAVRHGQVVVSARPG